MGKVHIGLNAEFSRSSDKPFEWAVEAAANMGYRWFEPMVHFGRELMSEAGYFHTVSMFDDPFRIKDACDAAGLNISGLQSHDPATSPDLRLTAATPLSRRLPWPVAARCRQRCGENSARHRVAAIVPSDMTLPGRCPMRRLG